MPRSSTEGIFNLRRLLRSLDDVKKIHIDRNTAAVAILLHKLDDMEILLVKRRENPMDPWSGQVALPGGKWEPCDASIISTLIREVHEEVGISIDEGCEIIGALPDASPLSDPRIRVVPFLILVSRKPEVKLSEELSSYAWVKLKDLRFEDVEIVMRDGSIKRANAFIYGDYIIWGLTARILKSLLEILNAARILER